MIETPEVEELPPSVAAGGQQGGPDVLAEIRDAVRALVNRQDQPETTINLGAGSGSTYPTTYTTRQRIRARALILSASAAATITLNLGGGRSWVYANVTAPVVIPLIWIIERGLDLSVTTTAGNVWAQIIGTTE